MPGNAKAIQVLQDAFKRKELSLHLGAGVSVGSDLPTWEHLVLTMYFSLTSAQRMKGWRPFPNYLYAISEWYLQQQREPLEITARKLQKYFTSGGQFDNNSFVNSLHENLYAPFLELEEIPRRAIAKNNTLLSIAKMIRRGTRRSRGIRSVISYNYDDLLERALDKFPHQPVYRESALTDGRLPIYHVHGYVPFMNQTLAFDQDLVFTEDQYHRIGRDPYHWSNIVQLQSIAGSAALMLGLSLADCNMRRLLDAIVSAPVPTRNFAILQRPKYVEPEPQQLDSIHLQAINYVDRFEGSGVKKAGSRDSVMHRVPGVKSGAPIKRRSGAVKGPQYRYEISGILEAVHGLEEDLHDFVLERLGVTPIWIEEFSEIPDILAEISS